MDSIIDEFEEQCRQGIFPPITRWLERIEEDKKLPAGGTSGNMSPYQVKGEGHRVGIRL